MPRSSPALAGAVLALLSPSPAAGQIAPDTLRLADVLAALSATPAVEAARLEADALAAEAATAGAWPDLEVEGMVMPVPMHTGDGEQRGEWRVAQMVPWPGTLALRRQAAGYGAEAANARAGAVALDLALEAQEAYHTLAYVQTAEALVRDFRQRIPAFAEAAAVRYEVGQGPQAAILRTQLEGWRMEERLILLSQERMLALTTLARLLDRPDLPLLAVVPVEERIVPADVPALAAFARRLRPDAAALDAEARRAEAEIALAQRAFYPEIGASVTYFDVAALGAPEAAHDGEEPTETGGLDALGIGVTVRLPLDRASRRAGLEASRLRARQVEARKEVLTTAIETEIMAHLHHAHHEREVLWVTRNRLIPQAQSTVESTLAAYTAGQADFLLLLDAERTLLEIRLAEAEAVMRYQHAAARLARALGLFSLDDLPPELR
jgi:outer membrane protein TolC